MAIEIRINKEIGNFEPKFVGPFTIRQAVCLLIGAPICFFIYKFTAPVITADLAGFLCTIPAAAAVAIGWVKPYGMKMEKFIQSVFINRVVAPANRRYKTENHHEKMLALLAHECEQQELAKAGKKKQKNPSKPQKYKVSSAAVR